MEEKIGVVGMGYVGSKIYDFFKSHKYDVCKFDVDATKTDFAKLEDLNDKNLDFIFVCVSTPMLDNGSCDTSIMEETIRKVVAKTIVVHSTVPPGTTQKMEDETKKDIVFIPEYFGETKNHFLNDLNSRDFLIIGGRPEVRRRMVDLYKQIFDSKRIKFAFYSLTSAEIIKYMTNSYLASKVIFCEEFLRICEAFNQDYYEIREGWLLDPRIGASHTLPRKDGTPGFGGKCFPKDVSAIIEASKKAGHNPEFLETVFKYNNKIRQE